MKSIDTRCATLNVIQSYYITMGLWDYVHKVPYSEVCSLCFYRSNRRPWADPNTCFVNTLFAAHRDLIFFFTLVHKCKLLIIFRLILNFPVLRIEVLWVENKWKKMKMKERKEIYKWHIERDTDGKTIFISILSLYWVFVIVVHYS